MQKLLLVVQVHTAFDYLMLTICYLFGTGLCTAFRWMLWASRQGPVRSWRQWMPYWSQHAATNITSLIVALVVGTLWLTGRLRAVAGLFEGVLAGFGVKLPADQVVPVEYGTAIAAGFFFDLTSRWAIRYLIGKFPQDDPPAPPAKEVEP